MQKISFAFAPGLSPHFRHGVRIFVSTERHNQSSWMAFSSTPLAMRDCTREWVRICFEHIFCESGTTGHDADQIDTEEAYARTPATSTHYRKYNILPCSRAVVEKYAGTHVPPHVRENCNAMGGEVGGDGGDNGAQATCQALL